MQRQEMLAQLQDNLQEPAGGQGSPAKFRLNYMLTNAANDIAAKYKCLYGTASANIVANQATYSSPTSSAETANLDIVEIFAVTVYDSTGNPHTLPMKTVQQMDAEYPGWRTWLPALCPYYAVTLALNQFILTPAPSYNSAYDPTGVTPGGYTVEGIAIPARSWDAPTAECPLATQVHQAVVDQATLYRIAQNPTKDNIARADYYRQSLQSLLDTFESTVIRFTQATRVPSYTTGNNVGGAPDYTFNPLDLA